jgi:superfamily II DNA or RNA helicase
MVRKAQTSRLVVDVRGHVATARSRLLNKGPGHFVRSRLAAASSLAHALLNDDELRSHLSDGEVVELFTALVVIKDFVEEEDGLDFNDYLSSPKFANRRDKLIEETLGEVGLNLGDFPSLLRTVPNTTVLDSLRRKVFEAPAKPPAPTAEPKPRIQVSKPPAPRLPPPPTPSAQNTPTRESTISEPVGRVAGVPKVEKVGKSFAGPTLRKWQREALAEWKSRKGRGVVEAITGTGKTMVGMAAIHGTVESGGKALVIVPTRALLVQWQRNVQKYIPGARVGLLTTGHDDDFSAHDVIVGTIQTVSRRPPHVGKRSLIVVDEAHRAGAPSFSRALSVAYTLRLGLTATYERQGDSGVEEFLDPYFGGVIYSYNYGQALEDRVVSPFHLGFIATDFSHQERDQYEAAEEQCRKARKKLIDEFDYPEEWEQFFAQAQARLKTSFGDYESLLCARYIDGFTTKRTLLAEAESKEVAVGAISPAFGRTSGSLIFTETKDSAYRLAHVASQHCDARPLTGDSPSAEREAVLRDFAAGRINAVCAPRILDEGIDVPDAELAVIVAASRSKRQMIQRMGRVIRLKSDGRVARILVAYIRDTVEDPAQGGHEAFIGVVRDHAISVSMFEASQPQSIIDWLQS